MRAAILMLVAGFGVMLGQAAAAEPNEKAAARVFDRIARDPVMLRSFLRKMPKGGDLHTHLSGTPYAEEYIEWAAARDFCIDVKKAAIAPSPCSAPALVPARGLAQRDLALYTRVVDSLSMRGHDEGEAELSGHDQFFGTFGRFGAIASRETGKSLASVRRAAAGDNLSYLELGFNPPSIDQYTVQSSDPAWAPKDLAGALTRFAPEIPALVAKALSETKAAEAQADALLGCKGGETDGACGVEFRFNCYGLRVLPAAQVFRQVALCFALAQADPRFTGLSLVAPEDDPVALADYGLHMEMVAFLKSRYPAAQISLHAGELTLGLVPLSDLRSHIADAIEIAGSRRIGHGVDIAFETEGRATMARMAKERIAVEINLSSNDAILGVKGADHPINLYRAAGVPFVLSSDDQGVLRTDMTEQYVRAAWEHGLKYGDLKTAARNGLHYAFVQGASIWENGQPGKIAAACSSMNSRPCADFVKDNLKATLQLRLERDFSRFEAAIKNWPAQ